MSSPMPPNDSSVRKPATESPLPESRNVNSPGAATPHDPVATPADSSQLINEQTTANYNIKDSAGALSLPVEFGKYLMLQQIAKGGMGIVYKARDIVLGRTIALKMIRSGVLASDEEVERFYREAQAIANLKHPHIVQVLDYGNLHGNHYFTMALADQGSLAKHIARFQKDPRAAVALIQKVARAVEHIHSQGILHRDLKPGNILLEANDEPLVSDFGLSKSVSANLTRQGADEPLTSPGEAPGTPAYMAPEQLIPPSRRGKEDQLGPATDVWALGVILYEVLTGRRPFNANNTEDITTAIRNTEPTPPRKLETHIDKNLETIVLKCLEKDPKRRYPSAGALADDLGCWLRGEPIRARPAPWRVKIWRKTKRYRSVVGVGVLVGFVGLSAILLLSSQRRVPENKTIGNMPMDPLHLFYTTKQDIIATGKLPPSGKPVYGYVLRLEDPSASPGRKQPIPVVADLVDSDNDGRPDAYRINFGPQRVGTYRINIRSSNRSDVNSEWAQQITMVHAE